MKNRLIFALALLISNTLTAQNSNTDSLPDNYYQVIQNWQNNYVPDTTISIEADESGLDNEMKRSAMMWMQRLSPDGHYNHFLDGILGYACNYNYTEPEYIPHWKEIGPIGIPNGANSGRGNGVINRLLFNPWYNNGSETIYAASHFGGLWRSRDRGLNWEVVNTDVQLPFCEVSDVAVSYQDTNVIYISTGDGDNLIYWLSAPYHGAISANPLFTAGVWRSVDYGENWEKLSGVKFEDSELTDPLCNELNYIDDYTSGGTIRKLLINPADPTELFVATSNGVYKTNNATDVAGSVKWKHILTGSDPSNPASLQDKEFRGLEFKPFDPDVVYASGKDIYVSKDNGESWVSFTGSTTGLDLANLPNSFHPLRINITVTPKDPQRLYAYIVGQGTNGYVAYIYVHHISTDFPGWKLIKSLSLNVDSRRLAIAVSPVNENHIVYGEVDILGTDPNVSNNDLANGATNLFKVIGSYISDNKLHADFHALAFEPIAESGNSYLNLFGGTDGGIYIKNITSSNINTTGGWDFRSGGLSVATLWNFDDSEYDPEKIIVSLQDCGTNVYRPNSSSQAWSHIHAGDGFSSQIDDSDSGLMFYVSQESQLYRYKYENNTVNTEFLPKNYQNIVTNPGIFQLINHPKTDKMYFKFSEVYRRLSTLPPPGTFGSTNWEQQSDASLTFQSGQEFQTYNDFDISEVDPNYRILCIGGVDDESQFISFSPYLLIDRNGDCPTIPGNTRCYVPVALEGLNLSPPPGPGYASLPIITSVTFDPEISHKFYITFSGYEQEAKVYSGVISDEGSDDSQVIVEDWTNEDASLTLPNLPVNDLVCQRGTNYLYVATDAGVYVRNGDGEWKRYGDLPNVRCTKIKINYCEGKIRVATFGRGLWEGDLLPYDKLEMAENKNEKVIGADGPEQITWNENKSLNRNLRIKDGSTLRISSTLSMPAEGRIYVERNARLIVSGGTITNHCGKLWEGIIVSGDPTKSQSDYTENGVLKCAQGKVILDNATIQNARHAIRLFKPGDLSTTGGIVQAVNSIFRNNHRGVEYDKYRNFDPAHPAVTLDNRSVFTRCTFTFDDDYPESDGLDAHVRMKEVKGIRFSGCVFDNQLTNASAFEQKGSGIYSLDAGFSVTAICNTDPPTYPCDNDITRSKFEQLRYGILASSDGASLLTFKSDQTDFVDNFIGVYNLAVDNITVTRCNFEVGDFLPSFGYSDIVPREGLVILGGTNYKVEDNMFKRTSNSLANSVGARIVDTKFNNRIYHNRYEAFTVCNLSNGDNQDDNNLLLGLHYLCNGNTEGFFDFAVTDIIGMGEGIANRQGLVNLSAGNTFSLSTNNLGSDFNNEAINPVRYYYYDQSIIENPVLTNGIIKLKGTINTCLSSFDTGMGGLTETNLSELKHNVNTYKSQLDTLKSHLFQLKDGGNTAQLLAKINNATSLDAAEIKSDLLSISPYLSSLSLSYFSDRSDLFDHNDIFDVFKANPDELDDYELMQHLLTKADPLPDSLVDALKLLTDTITARTAIEDRIVENMRNLDINLGVLIRFGLLDTAMESMDTIQGYFMNKEDMSSDLSMVAGYLQQNATQKAEACLDSIQSKYTFTSKDSVDFESYRQLKSLQFEVLNDSRDMSQLDSIEVLELKSIADSSKALAGFQVQSILNYYYGYDYFVDAILPEISSSLKIHSTQEIATPSKHTPELKSSNRYWIQAQPNPVKEICILRFEMPEKADNAYIQIRNMNGQLVQEYKLNEPQGELFLNTSGFLAGVYYYSLIVRGKVKESHSLLKL